VDETQVDQYKMVRPTSVKREQA